MYRIKNFLGITKSNKTSDGNTATTINELKEMEEMLLKKQTFLEDQVENQVTVARKYGLKNKRQALNALKRKKRLEQLLQQLDGTLTTLEMQREALESAKNNVSVLQAMKTAAVTLKQAQLHMDVDKVHDIMEDIAEQQDLAKEISDAISNPIGSLSGIDIDDADLERELEELEQEDLDRELLRVTVNEKPERTKSDSNSHDGQDESRNKEKEKRKSVIGHSEDDKELEALAQWASV